MLFLFFFLPTRRLLTLPIFLYPVIRKISIDLTTRFEKKLEKTLLLEHLLKQYFGNNLVKKRYCYFLKVSLTGLESCEQLIQHSAIISIGFLTSNYFIIRPNIAIQFFRENKRLLLDQTQVYFQIHQILNQRKFASLQALFIANLTRISIFFILKNYAIWRI